MTDLEIMKEALAEANKAYERGECPVGAVLVQDGKIIASAGNEENERHDPTAHAEILVLRKAGQIIGKHTFPDCTVYTTLWPCPMCQGVLMRAKIKKIICGARSYKWIVEKDFDKSNLIKHGPIMEEACRGIYVQWLKENGLTNILESGTLEE